MPRRNREPDLVFSGPEVEPVDSPSWRDASRSWRQQYYATLGEIIVRRMRAAQAQGRDRYGEHMPPRQKPRRDGADGPVLTPHREQSRSRRLLASWATDKGVRVNWRGGWRRIIDYHGEGRVIGAYLRDLRGLSDRQLALSVAEARKWWADRHPWDRFAPKPPPSPPAAPAQPRFPFTPFLPVAPQPLVARPR